MNLSNFIPIIAECYQGQKKLGVELGGKYLFDKIFSNINKNVPMVVPVESFNSVDGYKKLYDICSNTFYPLVLGGDHSIGTSTLLGSIHKYKSNVSVIWIDAHADINTMESSITKSRHGMPVAYASGLDKCWFDDSISETIGFDKIIYVGIRDLDQAEVLTLKEKNIKHYTVEQAVNFIIKTTDKIHISFDVDSLDPQIMSSTGTTAPDGLSFFDVKKIIDTCIQKQNLIALDVVEYNPDLGNNETSIQTMRNIFL
jgi:arginase